VLMLPKKGLKSLITHHPFPPSIPFPPSPSPSLSAPFLSFTSLLRLSLPSFPSPDRLDSVCVCGGREGVAIPPPTPPTSRFRILVMQRRQCMVLQIPPCAKLSHLLHFLPYLSLPLPSSLFPFRFLPIIPKHSNLLEFEEMFNKIKIHRLRL
jgi:hypothetical protein